MINIRPSLHFFLLIGISYISISPCFGQSNPISSHAPFFIEAIKDFPRSEKNLRKWDSPVVADLDQDGFSDLLLNDHGLGVSVSWNNKGQFAKPYDIIMGDLHGITVGDFDRDGNLEIVISRGGGSGSNARNSKVFRVDKERNFTEFGDFEIPLALMRGRTVKFIDGDNDGFLDLLNFAFPDKKKKGESENYIYKNNGSGELVLHSTLPAVATNGQKTLVTDFNSDGVEDLILYGEGSIKAFKGKGDLTYVDVSDRILPNEINHVSGIVEIDFDNDGDFDIFLTRGREFEIGETFFDKENNIWGFFTKRGKFKFEDLVVGDILNMENFQSQWPDNDAYHIGETAYPYEFSGETHSGKDIRLVNSDALGYPDKQDKTGFYIGFVGNQSWRISGDIRAPSTGIVHGVKSYPSCAHPKGPSDILLENKNGKFVDVTETANLSNEEHTVGATVADFDNNGFQDLLIIRRGDLIHANESLMYSNKGNGVFKKTDNHNIISPELGAIGMCVESLDYNKDGKVDVIIGNERGKWHLFKNAMPKENDHNFIVVAVGHAPSNTATALGAKVEVQGCDMKQIRKVGATNANYSLSFNPFLHFGQNSCQGPFEVKVTWTNGEIEKRTISEINTTIPFGK